MHLTILLLLVVYKWLFLIQAIFHAVIVGEQEEDVIENCTTGCDRVCTKDVEFAAAIA